MSFSLPDSCRGLPPLEHRNSSELMDPDDARNLSIRASNGWGECLEAVRTIKRAAPYDAAVRRQCVAIEEASSNLRNMLFQLRTLITLKGWKPE